MQVDVAILLMLLLASWVQVCPAKSGASPKNTRNPVPGCGIGANQRAKARIVRGRDSPAGAHPWSVKVGVIKRGHDGGTIIYDKWILTAKGSLNGSTPDKVFIKAGYSSIDRKEFIIERKAVQIIEHPEADIAVIKLNESLPFRITSDGHGSINRVCMPESLNALPEKTKVTLSGWGSTYDGNSTIAKGWRPVILPERLQEIDMILATDKDCEERNKKEPSEPFDKRFEICAKKLASVSLGAGCYKDAGYPFVHKVRNKYELVGIAVKGDCKTWTDMVSARKLSAWISRNTRDQPLIKE